MSALAPSVINSSSPRDRRRRAWRLSTIAASVAVGLLLPIVGPSTGPASAVSKGSLVLVGDEPHPEPLPQVYALSGRVVIAYPCVEEAVTEAIDADESKANADPYPQDCQIPYTDATVMIRGRTETRVLPTDAQGRFVTALPLGAYAVSIIHPAQYAPAPQPECGMTIASVPQVEPLTVLCAPAVRTVHVVGSVTQSVHPCPADADCADILVPTDGYKVVFSGPNRDASSGVKDGRYSVDVRPGRYAVTVQRTDGSFCPPAGTVWVPDTSVFESNISC